MALSNTAVPRYYGQFREAVIRGETPISREVELEMHRIDDLIANPGIYYDDKKAPLQKKCSRASVKREKMMLFPAAA